MLKFDANLTNFSEGAHQQLECLRQRHRETRSTVRSHHVQAWLKSHLAHPPDSNWNPQQNSQVTSMQRPRAVFNAIDINAPAGIDATKRAASLQALELNVLIVTKSLHK